MLVQIKVPEVGESITEGTLTQWFKEDGDFVESQEPLFELETDKITVDVPCEHEGVLQIQVPAGSRVRIGQVVAAIDTKARRPGVQPGAGKESRPGSQDASAAPGAGSPSEMKAVLSAPAQNPPVPAKPETPSRGPEPGADAASGPGGRPPAGENAGERPDGEEMLSPAVRRTVAEFGLDSKDIRGSGRGGRVTKEDVLAHLKNRQETDESGARAEPAVESGDVLPPAPGTVRQTRTRMSPLRRRISERLVMAQQTAAILTTFNEADMTSVLAWRKRHNATFQEQYGVRLGLMSFFVKAAVDALKKVPAINAQIQDDEIVQNHYYDIGVAVGTERGLVVPVIRDADRLGFAEIEKAIADLGIRVKEKTLTLSDLTGGVFTLSNGGVYGSLMSTPILNPPQSGILGMHAVKKRPVVVEDQIVIRPMMYLALSYDHRLVDGREAVTFLRRIVDCIENPERMLLGV